LLGWWVFFFFFFGGGGGGGGGVVGFCFVLVWGGGVMFGLGGGGGGGGRGWVFFGGWYFCGVWVVVEFLVFGCVFLGGVFPGCSRTRANGTGDNLRPDQSKRDDGCNARLLLRVCGGT